MDFGGRYNDIHLPSRFLALYLTMEGGMDFSVPSMDQLYYVPQKVSYHNIWEHRV